MDIETMAQKIAELWRSQDTANHALGLSFLQSQTEDWDKERLNRLLQRVVYHYINVPEFRDGLKFSNYIENIKADIAGKIDAISPVLFVTEWQSALKKICPKNERIKLGGYLNIQIVVEPKNEYLESWAKKMSRAKKLNRIYAKWLKEKVFEHFLAPEKFTLIISHNLAFKIRQSYCEYDFIDDPTINDNIEGALQVIAQGIADYSETKNYQFYDPLEPLF